MISPECLACKACASQCSVKRLSSSGGSPSNNQLPFYRVTLHIDHYSLHGVPEFFHPQPGMPVTADIKVGKRTIVQYFLNTVVPAATVRNVGTLIIALPICRARIDALALACLMESWYSS
ncbi:hypothetical protein [Entomobacter blattae]|uniref:Uncharacterized protein n=1 Tax=Entomobacter blattae TaxID=2762277 RepID=A0A7H1NR19_9PROT|nr:hypothetical protein JGUZn3_09990 [Entomobacter blattae]